MEIPEEEPSGSVRDISQHKRTMDAQRSKKYRKNKKNDPAFKQKEALRKKSQRLRIKESSDSDRKAQIKESNKIRQARYREKKKREALIEGPTVKEKRLTRGEHEKRKDSWREAKQKSRANMSSQKKRRIREYDQRRKAASRRPINLETNDIQNCHSAETVSKVSDTSESNYPSMSVSSSSAVKQSAYRLKKKMPQSPGKFAQVISHVIRNATPRKRQAIAQMGLVETAKYTSKKKLDIYTNCMKATVNKIRGKRTHYWNVLKRCLAYSLKSVTKARNYKQLSADIGIDYKFLRKYTSKELSENPSSDQMFCRKRRCDALDTEVVAKVSAHFVESSAFVPDKKCVSTKTLQAKKVLEEPIAKVYEDFKKKNPGTAVSQSQFHKLRPIHVKTTRSHKLYQSLCEYCANAKLKLDVVNRLCNQKGLQECKIADKVSLVNLTVCPKPDDAERHKIGCLQRKCHDCGVCNLDDHLQGIVDVMGNQEVAWDVWTTSQYHSEKKATPTTRRVIEKRTGTLQTLVDELKKSTADLSVHLFVAGWQKQAFDKLSKDPPKNAVIMHLDFSENYSTFHQQEISSAHWMKNLVTVHPLVAFYSCPSCGQGTSPVMDVLVFLTDDNQHDCHAVQEFVAKSIQFLMEERGISITDLYEFTDGCASQYKSKGPFVDISFGKEDFGINRQRNFFGSCHGKGPSDAAGGVTKTAARMGVIRSQAVITDAKTMYTYLKSKMTRGEKVKDICNHSRREFFLISSINRDRQERVIKTSLKGTRKMHSITGISPGVVCTRELSCHCLGCLTEEKVTCTNTDYVNKWEVKRLNLQSVQVPRSIGMRGRDTVRGRGRGTARGRGTVRGRGRGTVRGRGNSGENIASEDNASTEDDNIQRPRGGGPRRRGPRIRRPRGRGPRGRGRIMPEETSEDSMSEDNAAEDYMTEDTIQRPRGRARSGRGPRIRGPNIRGPRGRGRMMFEDTPEESMSEDNAAEDKMAENTSEDNFAVDDMSEDNMPEDKTTADNSSDDVSVDNTTVAYAAEKNVAVDIVAEDNAAEQIAEEGKLFEDNDWSFDLDTSYVNTLLDAIVQGEASVFENEVDTCTLMTVVSSGEPVVVSPEPVSSDGLVFSISHFVHVPDGNLPVQWKTADEAPDCKGEKAGNLHVTSESVADVDTSSHTQPSFVHVPDGDLPVQLKTADELPDGEGEPADNLHVTSESVADVDTTSHTQPSFVHVPDGDLPVQLKTADELPDGEGEPADNLHVTSESVADVDTTPHSQPSFVHVPDGDLPVQLKTADELPDGEGEPADNLHATSESVADVDTTSHSQSRYHVGDHILTKLGHTFLPAVVVDGDKSSEFGIWVQYFKKCPRKKWIHNDEHYFIVFSDIVKNLDVPSILCVGSRVYYLFPDYQ